MELLEFFGKGVAFGVGLTLGAGLAVVVWDWASSRVLK